MQVATGGCRWLQVAAGDCRWLQVAAGGYRWLQVAAGGCIEYCYYKRGGECGIIETAVRIFDLSEKKTKVRI